MPTPEHLIHELYSTLWTTGDLSAIDRLIAPQYTIHSDPGDQWEGQTLDHETYRKRVLYSRTAFPDLRFTLHDLIPTEQRVAVRWSAQGTQTGDLIGLPATGKQLHFAGQTIYAIANNQITGHWQVIDRRSFIQQLQNRSLS